MIMMTFALYCCNNVIIILDSFLALHFLKSIQSTQYNLSNLTSAVLVQVQNISTVHTQTFMLNTNAS